MEKFSILTFYWGDKENLESYVNHASKYTDDIVIVNIDLLHTFEDFGCAKIINVEYDYLIKNGHDDLLNLGTVYTKYDWIYYLAVGKRIVSLNLDLLNKYPNATMFDDTELNYGGRWVKFYNKKHCYWIKKVHEIISPIDDKSTAVKPDEIIIEWERCKGGNAVDGQYTYNDIREKKIYENYRQLVRVKWVTIEPKDPHPARDFAENLYNEHKSLFSMNKHEFIEYLSCNDFSYFGM